MNKKYIKIIVTLIVLLVLVICLRFYVNSNTVYIGSYTKLITIGKKIFKFNNNSSIKLRRVNIYKGNRVVKGYLKSSKGDNENQYYYVSLNNKIISDYNYVSSGTMLDLDVVVPEKKYKTTNLDTSTIEEINSYLDTKISKENISDYNIVEYDIDNDSQKEKVVFISYRINSSFSKKCFVVDNEDITTVLDKEYDLTEETTHVETFSLTALVDFNKDKKYEIVVLRCAGDDSPTYYDIYSYENGNIKEIK